MILLDANLLLYAHNTAATEHAVARPWFERSLSGPDRVGVPWPSILAFIRIASNPVVFRKPVSPADAWQVVAAARQRVDTHPWRHAHGDPRVTARRARHQPDGA